MKPFRPQVFLFRLLAAIFMWEGIVLAYSFWACAIQCNQTDSRALIS